MQKSKQKDQKKDHQKAITIVIIVVAVLVLGLVAWWSWTQLHGALSVSSEGFKFVAEGQKISVPCLSDSSLTTEEVLLYSANPDTLMKYLALQQVKTCSPPLTCLAKGFDANKLYLDPNCYVDAENAEVHGDVFEALNRYFGEGNVMIGSRPLESNPLSKVIPLTAYYFINTEEGVKLVHRDGVSLDEFWKELGVEQQPEVRVEGTTAYVTLSLPSYDDHLAYAIALNVEHFMKVKSVVLTINGLEVYRHQVPYALKLAKSNEGFLVTGEALSVDELESFLRGVSITDKGSSVLVKIDADMSTEDYNLVIAVLDTLSGKTVKIVAGPYSALGSFPSQF
jgi:hypothetical protein